MTKQPSRPSLSAADAEVMLRAAGYEPLAPYPGNRSHTWQARCLTCGRHCQPRVGQIEQGRRCRHGKAAAPRPVVDPQGEMVGAGYEPMEPYPGRAGAPWLVRCTVCGDRRSSSVTEVRRGVRCLHTEFTSPQAEKEVRALGFIPLEPYPGATTLPWKLQCAQCLRVHVTRLATRRTAGACAHGKRVRVELGDPETELRAAGYQPLAPYPGKVKAPWPVRCLTCGHETAPPLQAILRGRRCKHSQGGAR